jgi:hypothetical protein
MTEENTPIREPRLRHLKAPPVLRYLTDEQFQVGSFRPTAAPSDHDPITTTFEGWVLGFYSGPLV